MPNENDVNDNVENVSDDNEAPARTVDNVHAEFSRKTENMQAELSRTNAQLNALLETLKGQQPAQQPQGKPIKELIFDDPDAAIELITQRAIASANQTVDQRINAANSTSQVVNEITSKYAEFSQSGSEAAQLALKKANSLPAHLKGTPEGVRLAMLEAASELSLVPKSARKQQQQQNDDFTVGSNGTGRSGSKPRGQKDAKADIDPHTIAFAELIGIDVNDPKRLEGLAKASERKVWNRYK